MRIEDVCRLLSDYDYSAEYTDHRDAQLKNGWATVREKGNDTEFYAVFITGSAAKMSSLTRDLIESMPGPGGWEKLIGKDLERYSPFRIVSLGHFAYGTGNRKRFEGIRQRTLDAVNKAHDEKAAEAGQEASGVRPVAAGDGKLTTFFTTNGFQVQLYSGREYERMNESRRFFQKAIMPYADANAKKKYAYYVLSVTEGDAVRLGDALEEETGKALEEVDALIGLENRTEMSGLKSEETFRL